MTFRSLVCRFCKGLGLFFIFAGVSIFPEKSAHAQPSQPSRFELVHESGDDGLTMISMKENGLALIREKDKSEGNKRMWETILLDSTLTQTWSTLLAVENQQKLIGYEYAAGELFILFRFPDSNTSDLHLVRIYLFSHMIQRYDITTKLDFRLTHFTIVGNSAVFGGYVTRQAAVVLYEMATDLVRVVPGFFIDNTELLELKANGNSTFNALLVERGNREKKLLLLKTYDEVGSLLLEDQIEVDANKMILSGTTSTLEHDELLLAGTWGQGTTKQAIGLFAVLVDPFNKQPIHYFDFAELAHFLDYMPPKRVMKIKNKAERRRQAGKPLVYRTNVHVVKMEETAKGFVLLTEVYNPVVNANYSSWNNYYSPYYNPYGYGYYPYGFNPMMNRYYNSPYSPYGGAGRNTDVTVLHSSLVVFNRQGKLVEDFGFKFEAKLPALEQVSDFIASKKFIQFYKKEKEIYLSTNWEDGNPAEEDTLKIQLKSAEDVLRRESEDEGGVRYWFGPYVYVWGYETIKNKSEQSSDPVRYVYYVNKVKME